MLRFQFHVWNCFSVRKNLFLTQLVMSLQVNSFPFCTPNVAVRNQHFLSSFWSTCTWPGPVVMFGQLLGFLLLVLSKQESNKKEIRTSNTIPATPSRAITSAMHQHSICTFISTRDCCVSRIRRPGQESAIQVMWTQAVAELNIRQTYH